VIHFHNFIKLSFQKSFLKLSQFCSTGCIKKKSKLGISQKIDIVLKTKDFRRLGI
jgi:hypothetical protein